VEFEVESVGKRQSPGTRQQFCSDAVVELMQHAQAQGPLGVVLDAIAVFPHRF